MPKDKTKRQQVRAPHPNSRRAVQHARAAIHQNRVGRRKLERARIVSTEVRRLKWFREHVTEAKNCYTVEEVHQLVESYLARHDTELERLTQLQAGKGKLTEHYRLQHASKEDSLRLSITRERELYQTAGIDVPQLTDKEALKIFLDWKGEEKYLSRLSLIKFKSSSI